MFQKIVFILVFGSLTGAMAAQDTLAIDTADGFAALQKKAPEQEVIWQETVSYDGKFRVKAPGYMVEKVDTVKTGIGLQAYHTFFFQSPDKHADNLFYMVSYCDYPEGSIPADSTDMVNEFFDVTVKESAFSIAGDLIYSNPFDWNGYPGRIWRVDYLKGEAIIKTKAFLVADRYYTIQTVMLKNKSLNPSAEQFFNSFYLLDGAASGN